MSKRNQRIVSFSKNDKDIEDFLEQKGKGFSNYVKALIRDDMRSDKNDSNLDKSELKEVIKEVLKEINVKAAPVEDEKKPSSKTKKAISDFSV